MQPGAEPYDCMAKRGLQDLRRPCMGMHVYKSACVVISDRVNTVLNGFPGLLLKGTRADCMWLCG